VSRARTATFQFHSSAVRDVHLQARRAAAKACTSPITYTNLAQGQHTFSVFATINKVNDPMPATKTWTVDLTPPTTPGNFAATATSPLSRWRSVGMPPATTPASPGYDILRDGVTLASIAPGTSYIDSALVGSATHQYARYGAGATSPAISR